MPITVTELAKVANVSPSTVSRALRDSPLVNEETKKRIKLLTEKFNCRPNRLAESFFAGKSSSIGIIVPDISYPFYSKIVAGIEGYCSEKEYCTVVCNSYNKPELEKKYLQMLVENRVAGIIIAATQDEYTAEYVWLLQREHVPLVAIDRRITGIGADFVGTDDVKGAYEAVKHLIGLGHRRIAYISGPSGFSTSIDRLEGYMEALAEAGIAYDRTLVVEGASFSSSDEVEEQLSEGASAVRKLFALDSPPTGIFSINDYVAIGAYQGLKELGLSVPKDVSLVGYADFDVATRLLDVPLTTIAQPIKNIGSSAARMLLERRSREKNDKKKYFSHILDVELIVRKSTARIT